MSNPLTREQVMAMLPDLRFADFTEANLRFTNLRGADLTGTKGIVSFGPVGRYGRIGYAVKHPKTAMVKLGCFWGTEKEALDAIRKEYGPRSTYAALVKAACKAVMEGK